MLGQAANRYYLRDKKNPRAFTALTGRKRAGRGGGKKRQTYSLGRETAKGGKRRQDWFLPLKSSAVEQNSRIPEDLLARV